MKLGVGGLSIRMFYNPTHFGGWGEETLLVVGIMKYILGCLTEKEKIQTRWLLLSDGLIDFGKRN